MKTKLHAKTRNTLKATVVLGDIVCQMHTGSTEIHMQSKICRSGNANFKVIFQGHNKIRYQ